MKAKETTTKDQTPSSQPEQVKAKVFEVPEGEENTCHVMIEQRSFDQHTGEKKSNPYMQKFLERDWAQFLKYHKSHGYTIVEVLHLPEEFQPYEPEQLSR